MSCHAVAGDFGPLDIDYIYLYKCTFRNAELLLLVFLCLWILMLINILGKTASDYFSPTVALLSVKMKLGHNLAGVTLLAFANGAPDVFSSISGLTSGGNSDISIGSLLGGAFFVTTVVVGTIGLLCPCEFAKADFTRDVAFLLVALTIVIITAYIGYVSVLTVVVLFLVYFAYITIVVATPLLELKLTGVDADLEAGDAVINNGYNNSNNSSSSNSNRNIAASSSSTGGGLSGSLIQNVQTAFWFHNNLSLAKKNPGNNNAASKVEGVAVAKVKVKENKSSSSSLSPYGGVGTRSTAIGLRTTTANKSSTSSSNGSNYKFVILADEDGDEEKGEGGPDTTGTAIGNAETKNAKTKTKDIHDVDEHGNEVINLSGSMISSPIFSATVIEEHFTGGQSSLSSTTENQDNNAHSKDTSHLQAPHEEANTHAKLHPTAAALSRSQIFDREMRRLEAIAEGATPTAKLSERFRGLTGKIIRSAKEVHSRVATTLTESLLKPELPEDEDSEGGLAATSDDISSSSSSIAGARTGSYDEQPPPSDVNVVGGLHGYDRNRSSLIYSLYWQPTLLRRRLMKRLEASDWNEYPIPVKIITALEFPLVLLRDLTIPTVDAKLWFKPYAVIQPISAPLFFLLTTGNIHAKLGDMPLALLLELLGLVASFLVFVYTHHGKPPRNRVFTYALLALAFLMCVNWIYVIAGELVACLASIGRMFKIPPAYLGLTVLAWGNSVGDFFSNISVAQRGFGEMAVGGCFGGPLFNILIGLGLPMAYLTARSYPKPYEIQMDRSAVISVIFFYFSLVSLLIISNYTGYRLTKPLGIYLITLYIVYTFVQAAFVASEV